MSSKRGGGQPKGKNIAADSGYGVDQLNQGVQDVNLDSSQDGGWEEVSNKKNKKKKAANVGASKHSGSRTPGLTPRFQVDQQRTGGGGREYGQVRPPNNVRPNRTGGRGGATYYNHPSNAIPLRPQGAGNLNSRPGNAWDLGNGNVRRPNVRIPEAVPEPAVVEEDVEDPNDKDLDDDDDSDDDLNSDEYDSDQSLLSHEERKKNRWFAAFFQTLDGLTVGQIYEPTRQWHCPACQNAPGAIDWYKTLQSLVTHAKTKGSKRAKIHRDLAMLLEEELRIRGATVNPSGEFYGQWKGLNEVFKDKEIVWPPMVVIMNTQLEQDENDKWVGMGSPELLAYFESYEPLKALHSYGPKGHRGMSLLIFEGSAVGYTVAECLSKHFELEGIDRDAWDHRLVHFCPGGKRQLYGYMATKRDMDYFNEHSQEKSKLKFNMVSYQEKVFNQLRQMNDDYQYMNYYKTQVNERKKYSKGLEEANDHLSQKQRKSEEEIRIMRDRTQLFSEHNKEAMDYQEQFFKDQMKVIQDARNAKEDDFDKMQSYSVANPQKRDEKLEEIIDFKEEREKLMKLHEEKQAEMMNRYRKEKIKLEQEFDSELTDLMKYTPKHGVNS